MSEADHLWNEFHECKELLALVPSGFSEKSSEDDLRRYGDLCKSLVERFLKHDLRRRRIRVPSSGSFSHIYEITGLAHPAVCQGDFEVVQNLNASTPIDEIAVHDYARAHALALLLKDHILQNLVIDQHLAAKRGSPIT